MPKITIDLTNSDLEELLHEGKSFDWTYQTEEGQSIDVHLFNVDNEDEEDEE